jgi:hypothetical protein
LDLLIRQPFDHQSDKTQIEFCCGIVERSLKVFDQTFTARSIQAFERSLPPPSCHRDKSNFKECSFFGLRRFGCQFKPDLGHDLGIDLLQGYY